MEGDALQSRVWSLFVRILPTPFQWMGWELVRLLHWMDHGAARFVIGLRTSPAWYFVTLVGTVAVGLTIMLFVSAIDQTSQHHRTATTNRATVSLGREHLEKTYEWSAQDKWRVAHIFVPNKPTQPYKNIQIDSRLLSSEPNNDRVNRSARSTSTSASKRSPSPARPVYGKDMEVRLDLGRPKQAEQDRRLVAESDVDSKLSDRDTRHSTTRFRDPRLLVQASWEFGPECGRNDNVSLPIRRPIRVPVPEPEVAMFPVRHSAPDLTFEMAMVRHFTVSGLFPPGSRAIRQSERSIFPPFDSQYQNELVSYGENHWRRTGVVPHHLKHEAISYAGIGEYDSTIGAQPISDEHDRTLPAIAEVGLRVELVAPETVAGGQTYESILLVRNEGQGTIPRIEIEDSISQLETVVAASPEAMTQTKFDPETGATERLLHREIQELVPGEGQEFSLKWVAEGGRRQFHRARVIAQAEVSTMTEVNPPDPDQQMPSIPPEAPPEKHPALSCDVHYLERAYVGDDVEMDITIRNTGDTALHEVRVRIELPVQLSHRDGSQVILDAGNLPVRGRNHMVLKMSATQIGAAINLVQVAAAEHVQAHGRTSIQIVERPKEPNSLSSSPAATSTPLPEPARLKPNAPSPQEKSPAVKSPNVVPQKPLGECCCQRLSLYQMESGSRLP